MTSRDSKALIWKPMPVYWMEKEGSSLKELLWKNNLGSHRAAALMVYFALCLYAMPKDDPIKKLPSGHAEITYTDLIDVIGISKLSISRGLKILTSMGLIEIIKKESMNKNGNIYKIINYDLNTGGKVWCKIPYRKFIKGRKISNIFSKMNLRNKNSLHAMKLFFILLKYRSDKTGEIFISYEKIESKTGINRNNIKESITVLINQGLIYFQQKSEFENYHEFIEKSIDSEKKFQNIYFIRGFSSENKLKIQLSQKHTSLNESPF